MPALDSVVVRTPGKMSAPVNQDIVIFNPAGDNYVGLDEIGRRVWELLVVPVKANDLCARVAREFEGDPNEIAADVLAFVGELAAEGLVNVANP